MSDALDHLKAVAREFRATVLSEDANSFDASIEIVRGGGEREVFQLRILDEESVIRVREGDPRRLPVACLERHILSSGLFCLSYSEAEPSSVTDEQTAKALWIRIDRFLQAQLTANDIRKWAAQSNARAHGDAAQLQLRAETIAEQLGPRLLHDLRLGRLRVQRVDKRGKMRLELLRNGKRIARTGIEGGLVSTKLPCFCDKSERTPCPIGECGNHAVLAPDLIRDIYVWRKLHALFVVKLVASGYRCCGTLDVCEVRDAVEAFNAKRRQ